MCLILLAVCVFLFARLQLDPVNEIILTDEGNLQQCSIELTLALDTLGYSSEAMQRRRATHRSLLQASVDIGVFQALPARFSASKADVYLTGGKADGSSIWSGGDEDYMISFDRYHCLELGTDNCTEKTDKPVTFVLDDKKSKPGYTLLKSVTNLAGSPVITDKLVQSCITSTGHISSQELMITIYRLCNHTLKALKTDPNFGAWLKDIYFLPCDEESPKIAYKHIMG